jgi:hypothetical protein
MKKEKETPKVSYEIGSLRTKGHQFEVYALIYKVIGLWSS